MFQISGDAPTYAKCIRTPPQSACEMGKKKKKKHAADSVSNTFSFVSVHEEQEHGEP